MGLFTEIAEDMVTDSYSKTEKIIDGYIEEVEYDSDGLPTANSLLKFFDNICKLNGYVNGEKTRSLEEELSLRAWEKRNEQRANKILTADESLTQIIENDVEGKEYL